MNVKRIRDPQYPIHLENGWILTKDISGTEWLYHPGNGIPGSWRVEEVRDGVTLKNLAYE